MKIAFDSRCDAKGHTSFSRVLSLLRAAAKEVGIEYGNWREGPCSADVLWSPSSDIPEVMGPKKVGTLHDIIPLLPDGRPWWKRIGRRAHFLREVRKLDQRSDLIVTVSEFSRKSILDTFPHLGSKLSVVPNFPDQKFHSVESPPDMEDLGLPSQSILFVAALRRHKGWETLLRAWCALPESLRRRYPLILAGSNHQVGKKPFQIAKKLGVGEGLFLPGIIPDDRLPDLYRSATVFVFPSLLEGFGLPPLEAMACGTPVIASRSTSLPEVLGDAGLWFSPLDWEGLSSCLAEALSSPALLSNLKQKGIRQAETYSPRRTGESMLEALRSFS